MLSFAFSKKGVYLSVINLGLLMVTFSLSAGDRVNRQMTEM